MEMERRKSIVCVGCRSREGALGEHRKRGSREKWEPACGCMLGHDVFFFQLMFLTAYCVSSSTQLHALKTLHHREKDKQEIG